MHQPTRHDSLKLTHEMLEMQVLQIVGIENVLKEARSGQAKFFDHETVSSWLESWGTPTEKAPPR